MNVLDQFKEISTHRISSMTNRQRAIYALIVAKRLKLFYDRFSVSERFGDPISLEKAQDAIIHWISTGFIPDQAMLEDLSKRIDQATPDSEDFEDCADAMDAAIIHGYLIDFMISRELKYIEYASGAIYDLLDRKAQDALNVTTYDDDTEEMIENHPIIQENLECEYALLVEVLQQPDESDCNAFVQKWGTAPFKLGD